MFSKEFYENCFEALTKNGILINQHESPYYPFNVREMKRAHNKIKDIFPSAMSVTIKREFKKSDSNSDIQNLEAISLEEYFLEHIKEESEDKEYERLKSKVQELFSKYEELSYDTN